MASQGYSEACCTIPPVQAQYTPKGEYVDIGGLKTYRSGPSTAKTAIVFIYDIFGFGPQILQGADLLSHRAPKGPHGAKQFKVYVPDFLAGSLADPAWFPPDTPEKRGHMARYFGKDGPANAGKLGGGLLKFVEDAGAGGEGVEKWAVVGYCWGAKIAALASFEGTKFAASVQLHPSGMDVKDASKIVIPTCMLASEDEDAATVKEYEKELKVAKYVERYDGAPHGWMTSRGDLEDPKGKKDYERGYATLLKFFHEHL